MHYNLHNLFDFDLFGLLHSTICLAMAFACGTVIGLERQYRQRTAGLRTNALVAVSAAAFVNMALQLDGSGSASRVVAYVVSGVGFLGAGTIMKEGLNVRGLNTAATLWGSAATGACAGAGMLGQAILTTIFVLAVNTLLRPVVNSINRRPIDDDASEVTYQLCVISTREEQKQALAHVGDLLERANYPVGDLDVEAFGDDEVEMTATLLATSVDSDELDRIADELAAKPYISQAYWNTSTSE
ncbi:methyltransferase [Chromobacterium sinusclupearum]|uniref:Protein MgtC n=2 Tax=Chromobacterium TaxID=535 RepID=A0A2K4MPU3_9NEIS|nr:MULTISPECIES: MgtC/SapB family protein [Chromobacterium]POA99083.1 methyltransferase [Chromobacterium sinusclupearum]PRP70064.1 methyltransferase [Chromobacterium amazonense]